MADRVRPSLLHALGAFAVGIETGFAVSIVAFCLVVGDSSQGHTIKWNVVVLVSGLFACTTAPAAVLLLRGCGSWLAAVLVSLPVAASIFLLAA